MTKRVEVIIHTPQELNQSSYFRTGLFELQRQALISCRVKLDAKARIGRFVTRSGECETVQQAHPKTSFYTLIDHTTGTTLDFAIDGYDVPWSFSKYALDHCQYVFKRNYVSRYVQPLQTDHQVRLFPLGLTFMVTSRDQEHGYRFLLGVVLSNLNVLRIKQRWFGRRMLKSIRTHVSHWKDIRKARTVEQFEKFNTQKENIVLFQTRCFPQPDDPDAKAIHEERAGLIRYLRANLGSKFKGGFVPDDISRRLYPDVLTDLPTNPHEYLKLLQGASICIYTRGLNESPAWKMAEYLAQGVCVVAEQPQTELPEPMVHGKQVLYFKDQEECLEYCKQLLANTPLREELSRNARAYYENYVRPGVAASRVIEHMLGRRLNQVE